MKFRYLADPLFLAAVVVYLVNRYVFEPYIAWSFFSSYVNDLICIPFCVPIMLWAMRVTRIRRHDLPPTPSEILIPLLVWSVAFELIFPNIGPLVGWTFADPNDILCYAVGACVAAVFWRRWYVAPRVDASQSRACSDAPPVATHDAGVLQSRDTSCATACWSCKRFIPT